MSGIVAAMKTLDRLGLNRGSAGNCSVRTASGFLVTPSGIPSEALSEEMLVSMDQDGKTCAPATHQPSSEWRFHRDLYANRADVQAVVHTHSPFATTLACLHRDIPPFHYMIAIAGGDTIRCAPYALFGTQELSDHAIHALKERKACLLANHGMIAVGSDLADAMRVAIEVESLCEQYWRALQIGSPHILSADEMTQVIEKFKTYGPKTSGK